MSKRERKFTNPERVAVGTTAGLAAGSGAAKVGSELALLEHRENSWNSDAEHEALGVKAEKLHLRGKALKAGAIVVGGGTALKVAHRQMKPVQKNDPFEVSKNRNTDRTIGGAAGAAGLGATGFYGGQHAGFSAGAARTGKAALKSGVAPNSIEHQIFRVVGGFGGSKSGGRAGAILGGAAGAGLGVAAVAHSQKKKSKQEAKLTAIKTKTKAKAKSPFGKAFKPPFARMKQVSQVRDAAHGGKVFIHGKARKATMFSKPKGELNYTFTDNAGQVTRTDKVAKFMKSENSNVYRGPGERKAVLHNHQYQAGAVTGLGGAGLAAAGLIKDKPALWGAGMGAELAGLGVAAHGAHKGANKYRKDKGLGERKFWSGKIQEPADKKNSKPIKKDAAMTNPFGVESHDVSKGFKIPGFGAKVVKPIQDALPGLASAGKAPGKLKPIGQTVKVNAKGAAQVAGDKWKSASTGTKIGIAAGAGGIGAGAGAGAYNFKRKRGY